MGCNTSKEAVQPVEESNTQVEPSQHKPAGEQPEIDIDLNDPEAEKAATKIQAVFRGHKTRLTMRAGDAVEEAVQNLEEEFRADDKELCHAATKIQASFRGHMARKQTGTSKGKTEDDLSKELQKLDAKQEEDELADIDLNDPDLHAAASKIQATFRKKEEEDELADIDLTDPDLNKAATKIQASFRGHKVRKEVEEVVKGSDGGATGQ